MVALGATGGKEAPRIYVDWLRGRLFPNRSLSKCDPNMTRLPIYDLVETRLKIGRRRISVGRFRRIMGCIAAIPTT